MRQVLKWIGIVLGGVVGIMLLAAVGVIIWANLSFKPKNTNRPLYPITADTSPEGIARGKYLMESVISCTTGCHSEGSAPFAGYVEEIKEGPMFALFAVPNITQEKETGIGSWTDAEIARAIREGYDKDGVKLTIMPFQQYKVMSDEDVAAVVGYLRSVAPVKNEVPELQLNLFARILMAMGAFGPTADIPAVTAEIQAPAMGTVEYGQYLTSIGDCRGCHGPYLSGPISDFSPVVAPNLTPGGPFASWSEANFLTAMKTGVMPGGRTLSDEMPWQTYGTMTDEDLKDIYAYLQTLEAREYGK